MNLSLSPKSLYRWMVLSRCLAAIFGGYALAAASTVFLSLALSMPRAEAVYLASLLSYVVFVIAVLWVFAARTAGRAWLGVVLPTIILLSLIYAMKVMQL